MPCSFAAGVCVAAFPARIFFACPGGTFSWLCASFFASPGGVFSCPGPAPCLSVTGMCPVTTGVGVGVGAGVGVGVGEGAGLGPGDGVGLDGVGV